MLWTVRIKNLPCTQADKLTVESNAPMCGKNKSTTESQERHVIQRQVNQMDPHVRVVRFCVCLLGWV